MSVTGTFLCFRTVSPQMIGQHKGVLINVASTAGSHGARANAAVYVNSKGGVTLLTSFMVINYARQGIRVNAICHGPVDTPMLRKTLTRVYEEILP